MNDISPTYLEERFFLGRLLAEPRELADVYDLVKPDDLEDDRHKLLYRLLIDHAQHLRDASPAAVWAIVVESGNTSRVTYEYVCELLSDPPKFNATKSAKKLARLCQVRVLRDFAAKLTQEAGLLEDLTDEQLTAYFRQAMNAVASINQRDSIAHISNLMGTFLPIRRREAAELSMGLPGVDEKLNLFPRGAFVILAARPKMGKSTLMRQLILQNCGIAETFVVSLEESNEGLRDKLVCQAAGFSYTKYLRGEVSDAEQTMLLAAQGRIGESLSWYCTKNLDAPSIAMAANRLDSMGKPPRLVFVDHIHHMNHEQKRGENLSNSIYRSAQTLTNLAKSLNCTVVCLAQLNRSVEEDDPPRPEAYHLRECGRLEELAHHVVMLWSHDVADPMRFLYVPISREGHPSETLLRFDGEYGRFSVPDPIEKIELENKYVRPNE